MGHIIINGCKRSKLYLFQIKIDENERYSQNEFNSIIYRQLLMLGNIMQSMAISVWSNPYVTKRHRKLSMQKYFLIVAWQRKKHYSLMQQFNRNRWCLPFECSSSLHGNRPFSCSITQTFKGDLCRSVLMRACCDLPRNLEHSNLFSTGSRSTRSSRHQSPPQ